MEQIVATDQYNIAETLAELGIKDVNAGACTGTEWLNTSGELLESYSPGTGELIGKIQQGTWDDYETVIATAQSAFIDWRVLPAPKRGEIVRQIGNELRKHKEPLGRLVAHEMGKIYQEGLGEYFIFQSHIGFKVIDFHDGFFTICFFHDHFPRSDKIGRAHV